MKVLLDTHVFLWAKNNDARMAQTAWSILRDPGNDLFLSSASVAEIAIKTAIGKLSLDVPIAAFVAEGMKNGQITEVALRIKHALRLAELPLHHRDPFDRLLIVTALEEGMTLLTNDAEIRQYAVQSAW